MNGCRAQCSTGNEKREGVTPSRRGVLFVAAERALVSAQVRGWRKGTAWDAWRSLAKHPDYGRLLVEGDFSGIEQLAAALGE